MNNRDMPDICMQHLISVMLIDKTVSFNAAHDKQRMQDAAILRQRAKVQLIPDEELERLYPHREAIVEVTLADGARLTEHVKAVRGTSDNPMTRDEVVAKCRDLTTPILGATASAKLIERVVDLERMHYCGTTRVTASSLYASYASRKSLARPCPLLCCGVGSVANGDTMRQAHDKIVEVPEPGPPCSQHPISIISALLLDSRAEEMMIFAGSDDAG